LIPINVANSPSSPNPQNISAPVAIKPEETMKNSRCSMRIAMLPFAVAVALGTMPAFADDDTQRQIRALKEQVEALMRKVDDLQKKEATTAAKQEATQKKVDSSPSFAQGAMNVIKGLEFYGNLDLSVDYTTKGIAGKVANDGVSTPVGRVGWLPAISTNLSYLGLRGKHDLGPDLAAIYQLETQIDISATSGTVNTNSNSDSVVKGGLTSRDSFLGLAGAFGAVKLGKGDAPYKRSTAMMNPFSGTVGDYSAIMGNTGGDNRVEFGTRFDHAIWYESPKFGAFSFNALFSPGQNRSSDNSIQAIGESSCAGGNVPGSGALPYGCNDGSFGNAYSVSGIFQQGPVYLTLAYEMHKDVNRTSDGDGSVVTVNGRDFVFDNTVGIGNEHAWKIGVQYRLPTRTVLSAVYEDMKRDIPYHYFDERTRKGYWLALVQPLSERDSLSFGYGHAGKTPGAPGQHNIQSAPDQDNASNMYTGMYRHMLDKQTAWYVVYATQVNHSAGHFDLGAGGRANTTDCHDGSQIAAVNPADGTFTPGGPFCYTGGKLQAISLGLNYRF
jgi:predicted porin